MVAYSGLWNGVNGENYALQVARAPLNKKLSKMLKRRGVMRLKGLLSNVNVGDLINVRSVQLGADPFLVNDTGGTENVVVVTHNAHGLVSDATVSFVGAVGGEDVLAADLNRSHVITVLSANTYSFIIEGAATGDDDIGGANVVASYSAEASYVRVTSVAAPGNPTTNGGLRTIESVTKVAEG